MGELEDDRRFLPFADGYQLTCEKLGIEFTIERLRRERQELVGELSVACILPGARGIDGFLSVATMNLSSAAARVSRAKLLAERSEAPDLDWVGLVEALCVQTIAAERRGAPAVLLSMVRRPESPNDTTYDIAGWPWLKHHPMLTFADGGGLKSMLALYGAGLLARRQVVVAYADWELDAIDHRERLGRLFGEPLPPVHHLRCEKPLVDEIERLQRETRRLNVDYWILDSVGFGCAGPPESAEHALAYLRAVRQLGTGAHLLAHVNKSEQGDQKPFGSAYWHNGARATWFIQMAPGQDDDVRHIGLHNRKSNVTRLAAPLGFAVDFRAPGVTTIAPINITDIDALARTLPLWRRVKDLIHAGNGRPQTIDEIATALDEKPDDVRKATSRRDRKSASVFTTITGSDGLPRLALVARRSA